VKINNKKYVKIGFYCLVLLSILSVPHVHADDSVDKKNPSSITLDWQEFQKILKLDTDEVKLSWDEFTKLLQQTGFQLKPEYKVDGGKVILTREQFKNLIAQMKTPTETKLAPPCDYLITKASYNGVVDSKGSQFTALLELQIFKKDRKSYSRIPLYREELAIEDIRFDGKPASVITEEGWHYLSTDEIGKHSVVVKFSVKPSPNKQTPNLSFNIPQTPITHITLDIPKQALDVTLANAQDLETYELGRHTIVKGYINSTSSINITWKRKPVEVARGPAKIYAELYSLLSIEADAIRVTTKVKLNIIQNKLNSITLIIPPGYQILEVARAGKSVWNVREENDRKLLDVPFEYPMEGNQELTIKSEKLLTKETTVADFAGFEIIGAKRESGFIAGEVKSNAEAHIQEFKGLERIDFQKIPRELSSLSSRPMLFAFKYIRHPYNIIVGIIKYKKEEALNVIIDNAYGITLFQEDGKLVHQITFSIQNLWNQFLKLELPEDATIWSVYVDGKREKPSRETDGKILIPLARSQREGSILKAFNVELIYSEPARKFAIFGKKESILPISNILINRLEWNFYLPEHYKYIHFGGNLKRRHKELQTLGKTYISSGVEKITAEKEIAESDRSSISEEKKKTAKAEPAKAPIPEEQGLFREKVYRGTAGLLSVNVNIPFSGENYLFGKKIVEKGEPLHLSFTYVDKRLICWLIIVLILIILFILFKRRKTLIPPIKVIGKTFSKLLPLFKKSLKPNVLPIVLLILLIITILFRINIQHPIFFTVLILLFITSLARLFKRQSIQFLKFLWRPSVSLLIIVFLLILLFAGLVRTHLVREFFPLFLLFFICFIASVIRLIITILKMRKQKEYEKTEEEKRSQ